MRCALAGVVVIAACAAAQAQDTAPDAQSAAAPAVIAQPISVQPLPVQPAAALPRGYSRNTPVEKIAADPDGAAVLNKDMPGLLTNSSYGMFKSMSLRQLQEMSDGEMSSEDLDKTEADLMALPPR